MYMREGDAIVELPSLRSALGAAILIAAIGTVLMGGLPRPRPCLWPEPRFCRWDKVD